MLSYAIIRFELPKQLDASERVALDGAGRWFEIYKQYTDREAQEQASRCITCSSTPCNSGCPLGQNPPGFLRPVAASGEVEKTARRLETEGHLDDAKRYFELAHEYWHAAHLAAFKTSPWYGLISPTCPHDDGLCQSHCTDAIVSRGRETIAIGHTERKIWDMAIREGWIVFPKPLRERNGSVAIIGAGPAGVYAGIPLREAGHSVTMFDPHNLVGGLLIRGLPDFKIEKHDLKVVQKAMMDVGIRLNLCHIVLPYGADIQSWQGSFSSKPEFFRKEGLKPLSILDLLKTYDAVLDASGTYIARSITSSKGHENANSPIKGLEHAVQAIDFLVPHNDMVRNGSLIPAEYWGQGKKVVVIGAGDTGQDCIRTAFRDGAREVISLHRSETLRGAKKERVLASAESAALIEAGSSKGVTVELSVHPLEIEKNGDNYVVTIQKANGETEKIHADLVISAVGFERENLAAKWGIRGLQVSGNSTSIPNFFIAGDTVNGVTLAVIAAANGRQAGGIIDAYLKKSRPRRLQQVKTSLTNAGLL